MKQMHFLISDAAKKVEVESHVLRYWEVELGIPIKRNELGHRFYTHDDIDRFKEIKKMKEQGLQLKAIRMVLKNGKLERLHIERENPEKTGDSIKQEECRSEGNCTVQDSYINQEKCGDKKHDTEQKESGNRELQTNMEVPVNRKTGKNQETHMIEIIGKRELSESSPDSKEEKGLRLQMLLQHMISEAVKENNRELYDEIKECILKEMDYQFRQQEEKTEEWEIQRRQREDEHYQKVDEMLRNYSKKGRRKEGDKSISFGTRKKPSIV